MNRQTLQAPRKCYSCGTINNPNAVFCNGCGRPLVVSQPQQRPVQLQSSKTSDTNEKPSINVRIAIITTIGTVIVAIVSGIFTLVHSSVSPEPSATAQPNSYTVSNKDNGNTSNNGNSNMTNNGTMYIIFDQNIPAPTNTPIIASAATSSAPGTANPYAQDMQTLRFDTPLHDNTNPNVKWEESNMTYGTSRNVCAFYQRYYHAYSQDPSNTRFTDCEVQQNSFADFTYEVQMNIVQGNIGGIFFRAQGTQDAQYSYLFLIRSDGFCGLYVVLNTASGPKSKGIVGGTITQFNSAPHATNIIAIVARGSQIDIYVNQVGIASVNDSTYSQGGIGIIAWTNSDVVFSNAKLWTA